MCDSRTDTRIFECSDLRLRRAGRSRYPKASRLREKRPGVTAPRYLGVNAPATRESITSSRSRGSSLEFLARGPRFRVMVRVARARDKTGCQPHNCELKSICRTFRRTRARQIVIFKIPNVQRQGCTTSVFFWKTFFFKSVIGPIFAYIIIIPGQSDGDDTLFEASFERLLIFWSKVEIVPRNAWKLLEIFKHH